MLFLSPFRSVFFYRSVFIPVRGTRGTFEVSCAVRDDGPESVVESPEATGQYVIPGWEW